MANMAIFAIRLSTIFVLSRFPAAGFQEKATSFYRCVSFVNGSCLRKAPVGHIGGSLSVRDFQYIA
jgi:hypothetical protein